MIPATVFGRWKGACSNRSDFSLQGIAHIRRIMHENLYITFRTFPYEPFHDNTLSGVMAIGNVHVQCFLPKSSEILTYCDMCP